MPFILFRLVFLSLLQPLILLQPVIDYRITTGSVNFRTVELIPILSKPYSLYFVCSSVISEFSCNPRFE